MRNYRTWIVIIFLGVIHFAIISPYRVAAQTYSLHGRVRINTEQGVSVITALLGGEGLGIYLPESGETVSIALNGTSTAVVTADFNGDGRPDIAADETTCIRDAQHKVICAEVKIAVILNNVNGRLSEPIEISTGVVSGANYIAAGDFNRDGVDEIAFTDREGGNLVVFSNILSSTPTVQRFSLPEPLVGIVRADINGDKAVDLVSVTSKGYAADCFATLLTNNGQGMFTAKTHKLAGMEVAEGLSAGDMNLDGKDEIIIPGKDNYFEGGQEYHASVSIWGVGHQGGIVKIDTLGVGPRIDCEGGIDCFFYEPPYRYASPVTAVVSDIGNDGFPDILVGDSYLKNYYVFLNTEDGRAKFRPGVISDTSRSMGWGLAKIDYNNDGYDDYFFSNFSSKDITQLTFSWVNFEKSLFDFQQDISPLIGDGPESIVATDLFGISRALVKVGEKEVLTDDNGYFTVNGLAPGKYQVSVTRSGYRFDDAILVVKNNDVAGGIIVGVPQDMGQGSGPMAGGVQSYALWNGFVGMVNILELVNNSESEQKNATVKLYSIEGNLETELPITLKPKTQQDIIISDLPGFKRDSYGIININGDVSGRLFYYRPEDAAFQSFEFAFGIPISAPIFGPTSVGFNTFQPSSNPWDNGNLVANWLSIVNLDSQARVFTVNKYNQAGDLLSGEPITVPGFGRKDIDGGHENPGPSNVGLLDIIPESNAVPYLAQLMRYGYNSKGGFDFAFPLIAKQGVGVETHVPLSTNLNAQDWLEVINSKNVQTFANVVFYNDAGEAVRTEGFDLAPHAQRHLDVLSILGANSTGHATITGSTANSIIAQSMFYFRDALGGISSMYGSQAREVAAPSLTGSFNLFLGMQNNLKLVNTASETATLDLSISSLFSPGSAREISIPPFGSLELGLHDTGQYGTLANSYGAVLVKARKPGQVLAEIVRVHYSPYTGGLDFVAPTEVR